MTEVKEQNLGTRIFELLREISESNSHSGLLIVFSDIYNVLNNAVILKEEKSIKKIGNIYDEEVIEILKQVGNDGAVLINKYGIIFSPSVCLGINLSIIDRKKVKKEYAARHTAALATSASTKALVYTLSEKTGTVREFAGGRVIREYEPII